MKLSETDKHVLSVALYERMLACLRALENKNSIGSGYWVRELDKAVTVYTKVAGCEPYYLKLVLDKR